MNKHTLSESDLDFEIIKEIASAVQEHNYKKLFIKTTLKENGKAYSQFIVEYRKFEINAETKTFSTLYINKAIKRYNEI